MKIKIINPITCQIKREDASKIASALTYTKVWYKHTKIPGTTRTRKERRTYPKDLFIEKNKDYWYFYKGHLNRVTDFLQKTNQKYEIIDDIEAPKSNTPEIPGITLRPDQLDLVRKVRRHKSGVIHAPTGSGKTIMQAAVLSSFPENVSLVLAHTKDIVMQTERKFKEFGFRAFIPNQNSYYTNLPKEPPGTVIVSTIQYISSLSKRSSAFFKAYMEQIETVIVDECHHVSNFNGMYGKILSSIESPIRIGFTATVPEDIERIMTLEGLLGPVIGRLTIQKAAELGILAKPKVKLLKVPVNQRIKELRRYPDVYDNGVVKNTQRNQMIINIVREHPEKTFLILVTKIEHGEILLEMGRRIIGNKIEFVRGSTVGNDRIEVKNLLIEKELQCVIATAVWREGVDIPSLDCVINAAGGKSEIMTLQAIGRGLRKTDEKDEVVIYDFFDSSHHYLISHFGERVSLYFSQNWL